MNNDNRLLTPHLLMYLRHIIRAQQLLKYKYIYIILSYI